MTHAWSEEQARWVFRRSATLRARGTKPVNGIVLPTRTFYPDTLDSSPKTVRKFFRRTLELGGLDFLDVAFEIVDEKAEEGGSCSSGGCSAPGIPQTKVRRIEPRGEGKYTARISSNELAHPTVLATSMVRIVASMFLVELDCLGSFAASEREAAVDLAATLLGFGPFIVNGSAIETKGCSGMKVHGVTTLSPGEAALALAVSCALESVEPAAVAKYLGRVGLECFADATRFVSGNTSVVERIEASPATVEDDTFSLKEPGNFITRAFMRMRGKSDIGDLEALEREALRAKPKSAAKARDPERDRRMAELRALVDETLQG